MRHVKCQVLQVIKSRSPPSFPWNRWKERRWREIELAFSFQTFWARFVAGPFRKKNLDRDPIKLLLQERKWIRRSSRRPQTKSITSTYSVLMLRRKKRKKCLRTSNTHITCSNQITRLRASMQQQDTTSRTCRWIQTNSEVVICMLTNKEHHKTPINRLATSLNNSSKMTTIIASIGKNQSMTVILIMVRKTKAWKSMEFLITSTLIR